MSERLIYFLLAVPATICALTVHEYAHAWAATQLGDGTARRQGRLTLDPRAHIEPLGFLMIALTALTGLPLVGWARPVPIDRWSLRHPRRDVALIALAGPLANVAQAVAWLGALWLFRVLATGAGAVFDLRTVIRIITHRPDSLVSFLGAMLAIGVTFNVALAAFNLIPLPPLDGHYAIEALGGRAVEKFYNSIRPYALLLLFVLIQTPLLMMLVRPPMMLAYRAIFWALGLPAPFWLPSMDVA